ncbi:MAG: nitroreductase/quinone reductase family protein [Gemmatimonadaceae bacterium]
MAYHEYVQSAPNLERDFYRTLNAALEPWLLAGAGSPGLLPVGIVLIETTGRLSDQPRRSPVAAQLIEGHLIVSTVRGSRSQWMRNLQAAPAVRAWISGEPRDFSATFWQPAQPMDVPLSFPDSVRAVLSAVLPLTALGLTVAVLAPASAAP